MVVTLQKNQKVNRLKNHHRFDYLIMRKCYCDKAAFQRLLIRNYLALNEKSFI